MSLWRQMAGGLRVLTRRRAADRDLNDEVLDYLERATADGIARGLSTDEARRAAHLELGNTTGVREEVRSHGWENAIGTLLSDLRYAARGLQRNPGFAAVTVLTLALGIGATTAIFSAVNPILFEPLPYPDPHRVMMLWYGGADGSRASQAFGTYRELVARSRTFETIAVMKRWQPTLTGPAEPERFEGQRVSASYFRVLGVRPALGRDFDPADDRLNGPNVVVLSDAVWRRRFGGDFTIPGRQVMLDDKLFTIAGVMPRGFENVLAPPAEVWSLLQYDASLPPQGREWGQHLRMAGRLRPGIDTDQARRELDMIARAPIAEFARQPWANMKRGLIVTALQDDLTRSVKPALLAVVGAVLVLLAIACVNVTNLLLARSAQRRGEFALRVTLGAARMRVVRQLLTESLLLAVLGGAAGMLIAEWGVRALVALSPPELPRLGVIQVDTAVFGFALGITTLIGLAVGLVPAWHASRGELHGEVQRGSRRFATGHQAIRRALVVTEVALALVLLSSAGLLLRSLEHLFAISPGFDAAQLLTMQVQVSTRSRFTDDSAYHRFFAQALEAVRQVPGVTGAAFTSQLPLSGDLEAYYVKVERDREPTDAHDAFRYAVTPGYFGLMNIPVVRGRVFDVHDVAGAAVRPVVINESFARRKFAGQDPVGQRVRFGGADDRPWDVIVGVVGDVKQASLAGSHSDAVYVTTDQWLWADNPLWLVVHMRGSAAALAPAIRRAVWSVDKDQPISPAATMEAVVAATGAQRRFALVLFEAFGAVALVLAAAGIYGVLSGSVTERTREIGVRSALGASRGDIRRLVLRQGMSLTILGATIGLAGAAASSRAIVTLLFGVAPLDPVTYASVVALLLGVSALACWVPAWRATRIDPAITLRAE